MPPCRREMVEARKPAAHRIGMFESGRKRDPDAEVLGCGGDDGDDRGWLVRWALHRPFDDRVRAVLVGVVRREFVGDEHRIEQSALHGSGHVLPVFRRRKAPPHLVLGMAPHTGRVTVHPVLDESQQMSLLLVRRRHAYAFCSRNSLHGVRAARWFGTQPPALSSTKKASPHPAAVTSASSGPA